MGDRILPAAVNGRGDLLLQRRDELHQALPLGCCELPQRRHPTPGETALDEVAQLRTLVDELIAERNELRAELAGLKE